MLNVKVVFLGIIVVFEKLKIEVFIMILGIIELMGIIFVG